MTEDEKKRLLVLALQERTDNFHIYMNVGTNDTAASVEAARLFSHVSGPDGQRPDGIMAVVPYYLKTTQSGLVNHFSEIAKAVPHVPLCVYNVPGRTGTTLNPQTFGKIVEAHQNIAAIKEAAGDVRVVTELRRVLERLQKEKVVSILSGDDPTFAPALVCGANGVISVSTNVIPEAMLNMYSAWKANNLSELFRLHVACYPINNNLFCAPNPIPVKWALQRLGVCSERVRAPLATLEEREAQLVSESLQQIKQSGIKIVSLNS